MIADLDQSGSVELPAYDLCVVGSGPAGATLARELAGRGLRIAVLESGKRRPTRHGDRLRAVQSEGLRIKGYSRERVLGGASTTWAGLSSPLDPADMAPRDQLAGAGWPIAREELLPYYRRAGERYRFPALEAFGPDGIACLRERGEVHPSWRRLSEKVFLAASEPQDFGREWLDTYAGSSVDLWLDATVTALEGRRERIEGARLRTSGGREHVLRAGAFVLATGGIENARLLLASRAAWPEGLGNDHDQVGRCFMNHPKDYFGLLHFARPVGDLPYYFGCLRQGFAGYGGLRLSEEEQARRGLLNCYVRLEPLFPWTDDPGVESLVTLVKRSRALFARWKARHADDVVTLRDYSETGDDSELQNERRGSLAWLGLLARIASSPRRVTQYLYYRLTRAKPRVSAARLRNFMEMEPHPENRVVLGDERDPYGQPLALVRHAPTELDRRSLIALHEVLAEELEQTGVGRLESGLAQADPWPITQDASHHMGTTRMGRDPRSSVVDPDLRVHGVENLWCAGASVFPTSGCANPTFTIVALSIRLAEHLAGRLGAGAPAGAEARP